MFGLDHAEVQRRRQYVSQVRTHIEVRLLLLPANSYSQCVFLASPEHENRGFT